MYFNYIPSPLGSGCIHPGYMTIPTFSHPLKIISNHMLSLGRKVNKTIDNRCLLSHAEGYIRVRTMQKKQSESRYRRMSAWAVRGTIIISDGVSDQASGTMEAWGASKDGPPVPRYILLQVLLAHRHRMDDSYR